MNAILRTLLSLMVLFVVIGPAAAQTPTPAPLTILVSIDAFRADYLDRGVTPNLSALAAGGARAVMRPSFPNKVIDPPIACSVWLRSEEPV